LFKFLYDKLATIFFKKANLVTPVVCHAVAMQQAWHGLLATRNGFVVLEHKRTPARVFAL
jgi:hypothetical protein